MSHVNPKRESKNKDKQCQNTIDNDELMVVIIKKNSDEAKTEKGQARATVT
jgi:hypothetical protein